MTKSSLNAAEWDGVAMPARLWAIFAVMFAVALSVIDGVIANIALPTICDGLAISSSHSIWIINGYQIAIIVSLLPLSALGDIVGYRRIYISGLATFTLASIGCAMSWDFNSLMICRIVQGIGASGVMSINTSIVRLIYPKRMLGRGLGINSTVVSVSAVAGPTIAAAILSVADWRWLFAVNIPIGLAAITLGYLFLPHNPVLLAPRKFMWRDSLLNMFAFGSLFAFVTSFSHGVTWWMIATLGVISVVIWWLFVRSQLRRELPILPFDLLRVPIFSLSVATSIMSFVAQMSMMVAMPFILQLQFGFTPIEVGAMITAWPIINMFATPTAGFLIERFHAGVLGAIGLTILTCGMASLLLLPSDPTEWDFAWRFALCGFGFGFFQAPNNSIIISSASLSRSGSASGMMATSRLAGQTAGAAIVAMLFYVIPTEELTRIIWVGVIFSGAAMVLSLTRLSLPLPINAHQRDRDQATR